VSLESTRSTGGVTDRGLAGIGRESVGRSAMLIAILATAVACHAPARAEVGPATWRLDPAFPPPGPDAVELHLLMQEVDCANGESPVGRIAPPTIDTTAAIVTVRLWVHLVLGDANCPSNPEVAVTVPLGGPLGERSLVDGNQGPEGDG
jgi:hypothetical protein